MRAIILVALVVLSLVFVSKPVLGYPKSRGISNTKTATKSKTSTRTLTPTKSKTATRSSTPTSSLTVTPSSTAAPTPTLTPQTNSTQITLFENIELLPGQKVSSQFIDIRNYSIMSIFLKATSKNSEGSGWSLTTARCYFTPDGYDASDRFGGEYPRTTSTHEQPNQITISQVIGPNMVCDVSSNQGGSSNVSLVVYLKVK